MDVNFGLILPAPPPVAVYTEKPLLASVLASWSTTDAFHLLKEVTSLSYESHFIFRLVLKYLYTKILHVGFGEADICGFRHTMACTKPARILLDCTLHQRKVGVKQLLKNSSVLFAGLRVQHTEAQPFEDYTKTSIHNNPLIEQFAKLSPNDLFTPSDFIMSENRAKFTSLCASAGIQPKIVSIGAGNMAYALMNGFVEADLMKSSSMSACDPCPAPKVASSFQALKVPIAPQSGPVLSTNAQSIVLLAVKPHIFKVVAQECAKELQSAGLVVSIMTGITLDAMQDAIGSPTLPIVRVMPNTPAMYGCGASVFAMNQNCTQTHSDLVQMLMSTVGTCHSVTENQIDAVTGLSGSGPAYVYTMIDAMSDGGVKMGLPRDLALHLAAQTVMGAASMVLKTGQNPNELKNAVCSPGGTTIAGVHALELSGARGAFISAVEAAVKRAQELGKQG